MDLNIPVILGTKREGRKSEYAAKLVVAVGNTMTGINAHLVDPRDFDLPGDGNNEEDKDTRYTKITREADAFFIVSPEYNHGYPGTLKRLLDSEYDNYNYKPVVFGGVSNGPWGGARMIEMLIPVAKALKMIPVNADVHFPHVDNIFDDTGELLQGEYEDRIKKSYTELLHVHTMLTSHE